jgi:DNA (cytosine-5)-methyltransferase 1
MESNGQILGSKQSETQDARSGWKKDWVEVAAELCRVDDGLPTELDGFELSKSKHRKERLKSLGNAIVPQVAVEIFKGIKSSITE